MNRDLYVSEDRHWRDWARDAARQGSPLYERLSLGVDGDPALQALTDRRRPGQPRANLLFAAVHFLLLKGADHPLRQIYATLGGDWRGDDPLPLFRDFSFAHEHQLRALIESRVTNTNEVARSALLRVGFAALARRESRPLFLIEIGPSAGLNLNWERYGIRYKREGRDIAAFNAASSVQLACELRGLATPDLSAMPMIEGRIGLERDPVDLADADDRTWLRALIWPEQPERLVRLERAIELYRERPALIRKGDALALLPEALAETPADAVPCVFHTMAVYQFSPAMKEGLTALLAVASLRRPIWQLGFEFAGGEDYVLTLTHHRNGAAESTGLALAQAHGAWMEWRG